MGFVEFLFRCSVSFLQSSSFTAHSNVDLEVEGGVQTCELLLGAGDKYLMVESAVGHLSPAHREPASSINSVALPPLRLLQVSFSSFSSPPLLPVDSVDAASQSVPC